MKLIRQQARIFVAALPQESVIANMSRRVLKLIREEYDTLQAVCEMESVHKFFIQMIYMRVSLPSDSNPRRFASDTLTAQIGDANEWKWASARLLETPRRAACRIIGSFTRNRNWARDELREFVGTSCTPHTLVGADIDARPFSVGGELSKIGGQREKIRSGCGWMCASVSSTI